MQETQQLLPSQPGYPAQDFQTHLQQQLQGIVNVNPQQIAIPQNAAEDAKIQLQQHINWYQATFGESNPNITISTAPTPQSNMAHMTMSPTQQTMNLPMHSMPVQQATFMPAHGHPHPHTVPNTPQTHNQPWSSPPQAHVKHARSQSFQLDTAPMPAAFEHPTGDFILAGNQQMVPQGGFTQDNFGGFGSDNSYASSAYSSSIADPSSPQQMFNTPHMPTVPEEPDLPGFDGTQFQPAFMGDPNNLLDATAGAHSSEDDFLYPPQAMSPRTAALASLGNINASIEETGVSPEQVNQYMSEQDSNDNKWTCLYPECNKRFGRKENIRAHIQTHLGDRQFKCNDCGKCFVRQHDLKRHAKIHSGTKTCVCPCGMSFARQDALTRHRQRGMCSGVLPGYEKNEEDRKKRGRPRKERPDVETRTEKATRARRMDAENELEFKLEAHSRARSEAAASSRSHSAASSPGGAAQNPSALDLPSTAVDDLLATTAADENYASASSESGASDCSLPITPPDTQFSDMYEEFDFENYVDQAAIGATGDAFLDLSSGSSASASWRADTPPTSPPKDYSSPSDCQGMPMSFNMGFDATESELRDGLDAFLSSF